MVGMTPEFFVDLAARTLRTALLLAAPPLVVGLLVGVIISIIQTVVQIQEQTLVLVPKMLAVAVVLLLFLPWMLQILLDFTHEIFLHLPDYVR
jgi:flagellar biosynthetic protein FliQ